MYKLTLALSISAWVQVDLLQPTAVSGLMIQGRTAGNGQRVTVLQVLYSNDENDWKKATVSGTDVS